MTIEGDSKEYELLAKWAKDFDCQGYIIINRAIRTDTGQKSRDFNIRYIK